MVFRHRKALVLTDARQRLRWGLCGDPAVCVASTAKARRSSFLGLFQPRNQRDYTTLHGFHKKDEGPPTLEARVRQVCCRRAPAAQAMSVRKGPQRDVRQPGEGTQLPSSPIFYLTPTGVAGAVILFLGQVHLVFQRPYKKGCAMRISLSGRGQ